MARYALNAMLIDALNVSLIDGRNGRLIRMWANQEMLEKIADLAMKDDHLLAMLVEWNETQDWGMQDLIFCKIVNYSKDKLNLNTDH